MKGRSTGCRLSSSYGARLKVTLVLSLELEVELLRLCTASIAAAPNSAYEGDTKRLFFYTSIILIE
jgi:hypothetical protein